MSAREWMRRTVRRIFSREPRPLSARAEREAESIPYGSLTNESSGARDPLDTLRPVGARARARELSEFVADTCVDDMTNEQLRAALKYVETGDGTARAVAFGKSREPEAPDVFAPPLPPLPTLTPSEQFRRRNVRAVPSSKPLPPDQSSE